MKFLKIWGISLCLCSFAAVSAKQVLPYKNPKLPIAERVEDLLHRMTLEEKVGQIQCALGWNYYTIKGKKVTVSDKFMKDF